MKMGNKLKKSVNKKAKKHIEFVYKDKDDMEAFFETIEKMQITNHSMSIPNPDMIKTKINNYTTECYRNITNARVYPRQEDRIYSFNKIKDNHFELSNNEAVNLSIIKNEDNTLSITYGLYPTKASSLERLITEYANFKEFINTYFSGNQSIDDLTKYLKDAIREFKIIENVGKLLSLMILPKDIIDLDGDLIRLLYWGLVKKKKIRENIFIKDIRSKNNQQNIAVNTSLLIMNIREGKIEILGKIKKIWSVQMFYNEIIKDFKEVDDEIIIYFKKSDETPYCSCTYFLSKEDAEKEMERINQNINNENFMSEYKNACLISELKDMEESTVHVSTGSLSSIENTSI